MPIIKIKLEIFTEPDGIEFHAFCPALKGLHTCGVNEEEALNNAKDAAIAYLSSLIKCGDPIPSVTYIEDDPRSETVYAEANRYNENISVPCFI